MTMAKNMAETNSKSESLTSKTPQESSSGGGSLIVEAPGHHFNPSEKMTGADEEEEEVEKHINKDSKNGSKLSTTVGEPKTRKPADPIMGKMGNETLKAELGRSAWKLLHTMAGKFPAEPTPDQQNTLLDFIYLFAQLYPCGECARHFKLVLEAHPPNVTSREGVSQWACKVHNVVNKRLEKPEFDCAKVSEFYKCGCAEEDEAELEKLFEGAKKKESKKERRAREVVGVDELEENRRRWMKEHVKV
ncbi:hypothetical protein HDV05_003464 [Chytridiales sp. JEL 0842]|nr:hypothetical protein HDV05_003464 [Chytridiales sp. JEL 0842]